ncbi:ACT domain-containing protein [Litorihabitans aurantiacus]|uniref:ACT domain-containing protein n=1 Tax=Litorihabitans aurantiacus TaxID=1930061 RepID=UPI0024E08D4E|nr:ACT domain-containing protein [Litorihabitans aurantiacus]
MPPAVSLRALPGDYVIARFPAGTDTGSLLPDLLRSAGLVSVTRTDREVSIVCDAALAPPGAEVDGEWRALYADGAIPFGLTGVVASLVDPLAAIGCPVFVVSTFDGDVLMTPGDRHADAVGALRAAGHTIAAATDHG